jgi:hypothetical protein
MLIVSIRNLMEQLLIETSLKTLKDLMIHFTEAEMG